MSVWNSLQRDLPQLDGALDLSPSVRHLDTITGLFVAVLIISNVAASKMIQVSGISFDGGTFLFPLSYIFGDVLTEVYGYSRSRKVIWLGFLCEFTAALTFWIVMKMPASPEWPNQEAFAAILGVTPRLVGASFVAYLIGEFSNSYVLAKLKVVSGGKHLWVRTIGSTIIGEGLDTAVFCILAFAGTFSWHAIGTMILFGYLFKVAVEVLCTPITYYIVGHLKRAEGMEIFDWTTNFNPMRLFGGSPRKP